MPRYLIRLRASSDPSVSVACDGSYDDEDQAATFARSAIGWQRVTHPQGHLLDTWTVAGSPGPGKLPRILASGKVEHS